MKSCVGQIQRLIQYFLPEDSPVQKMIRLVDATDSLAMILEQMIHASTGHKHILMLGCIDSVVMKLNRNSKQLPSLKSVTFDISIKSDEEKKEKLFEEEDTNPF